MQYKIILVMGALALGSCQKRDSTTPDASKVVFTITSPTIGHTYQNGDSVRIKASISYPSELHGYEVRVTDVATNTIVYDAAEHGHSDRFDIDKAWVINGAAGMELKLELMATIDHAGTVAEKSINFQYLP
jgi:hypothetical protein